MTFGELYTKRYSHRKRKPNYFHLIPIFFFNINKPNRVKYYYRFIRANRISDPYFEENTKLPGINAAITLAEKDLENIERCISSLISFSINEICKITLIVPDEIYLLVKEKQFQGLSVIIEVVKENDLIPDEIRQLVAIKFSKRYGWILQQLIKLTHCYKVETRNILILDSDTILTSDIKWIDADGNQVLFVSPEFNEPYYEHFFELTGEIPNRKLSFVAHQMVIQTELLRFFIKSIGFNNINDFIKRALELASSNEESCMSIDYEFYGQMMMKNHRSHVKLSRFCNISMQNPLAMEKYDLSGYKSVSFHAYKNIQA